MLKLYKRKEGILFPSFSVVFLVPFIPFSALVYPSAFIEQGGVQFERFSNRAD